MDWPAATAIASVFLGSGSAITVAVIKWAPTKNGKNGNGNGGVNEPLCVERRETINGRIGAMESSLTGSMSAMGKRFDELHQTTEKIFNKIDEINAREINKATGK